MLPINHEISICFYLSFCSLSFSSLIFVFVFYAIYIDLAKNFACRLIVIAILMDSSTWFTQAFYSVFKLATDQSLHQTSPMFCSIMGYFSNLMMLSTIIFSLLIPLSVYIQVIHRKDPSRFEKLFYLLSTTYALLFTSLPLAVDSNAFHELDFRCWIAKIELRLLAFSAHLFFAFVLGFFFLIRVLRTLSRSIFIELEKVLVKKLSWFPIITLSFWFIPAFMRFFIDPEENVMHFLLMPFQGLANSIFFGNINEEVRKKILALINMDFEELKKRKTRSFQESVYKVNQQVQQVDQPASNDIRGTEIENRDSSDTFDREDSLSRRFEIDRQRN